MPRSDKWKNRQLLYKRAVVVGDAGGGSLQSYLDMARQALGPIMERRECTDGDATHRFFNSLRPIGTLLMGTLVEYTRGASPVGFTLDDSVTEVPLEVLVELEEGREMVAGALHFGVSDHHVILMPSSTVRAGDFQHHLNWFLRTHTQALPDGATVILRDELAPDVRQHWQGVTGLVLRSPMNSEILSNTEQIPNQFGSAALGTFLRQTVPGWADVVGQLNAGQLQSFERLSVKLEIKFAGRSEKVDTAILDHVLATLPEQDWPAVELEVRGVGTVKSGQIRVAAKRSITHEKGIPVAASVAEKMHEWLHSLVETGRVRG